MKVVKQEEGIPDKKLKDLCSTYWVRTGKNPDTLLVHISDYNKWKKHCEGDERITGNKSDGQMPNELTTIHLAEHIILDVVPVSTMFLHHINQSRLPIVFKREEE